MEKKMNVIFIFSITKVYPSAVNVEKEEHHQYDLSKHLRLCQNECVVVYVYVCVVVCTWVYACART